MSNISDENIDGAIPFVELEAKSSVQKNLVKAFETNSVEIGEAVAEYGLIKTIT